MVEAVVIAWESPSGLWGCIEDGVLVLSAESQRRLARENLKRCHTAGRS